MKNFFKTIINYFKDWNWFELLFVFSFEIAFVVLGIVFKQTIFSILYSMIILLCILLQAKGKWYAYVFGIIGMSIYVYLSFLQHYWGEAVWNLAFIIPMYFAIIINWKRNQHKTVVKQRKITKLEWILFLFSSATMAVALYFTLKVVNTPQALTSTFSLILSGMANYLAMRRSDFLFIAYCLDDVFVIILWLIPVINGEIVFLNVAISMFSFLINDIYGVINWLKIKKEQTKELQQNDNSQIEQITDNKIQQN